jgi:hypothetical protein
MSRMTALCLSIGLLVLGQMVQATIFDNRYIPFLQRPYIVNPDRWDYISCDVFFATASQSFGRTDTEIGLPQLYGEYNQASVGRAFVAIGQPNPLPSRFQNAKIIWQQEGKLLAQGFEFSAQKELYDGLALGIYTYFMRVDTVSAFFLNVNSSEGFNPSDPGDRILLDTLRRSMNTAAGLTTNDHAKQFGFGDIDLYLMWMHYWPYCLKFRSIRAQASFGALIPSGVQRNVNEPTTIPFGGNGFWGVYGAIEAEFEVKEDWKFGGFLRASKRFTATKCERIPLCEVPFPYSPLVADVSINPGPTFVGMAWMSFEAIHKGLGMRLLLTVRRHWADSWEVPACIDAVATGCNRLKDLTDWGSDYITLNAFYDFGRTKAEAEGEPIIFFAWDVPLDMLVTRNTYKTNKVMLGVEFNF